MQTRARRHVISPPPLPWSSRTLIRGENGENIAKFGLVRVRMSVTISINCPPLVFQYARVCIDCPPSHPPQAFNMVASKSNKLGIVRKEANVRRARRLVFLLCTDLSHSKRTPKTNLYLYCICLYSCFVWIFAIVLLTAMTKIWTRWREGLDDGCLPPQCCP